MEADKGKNLEPTNLVDEEKDDAEPAADKGEKPELTDLVEEDKEREDIEAAARELEILTLSRMEFMRRIGSPVILSYPKVDPRILLNRKSNCDHIDTGSGPVDGKELLIKEERIWTAAMDYRKAKNMVSNYDLIPNNMTMYPVKFENHTWYHCNLSGYKKDTISTYRGFVQQRFFVEAKVNQGYNVVACIALDGDIDSNICKMCPTSFDILHPRGGGFICGSQEGQLLRHYSNIF